jgi:hypothetical protein
MNDRASPELRHGQHSVADKPIDGVALHAQRDSGLVDEATR